MIAGSPIKGDFDRVKKSPPTARDTTLCLRIGTAIIINTTLYFIRPVAHGN